jgi:hypothetical protein
MARREDHRAQHRQLGVGLRALQVELADVMERPEPPQRRADDAHRRGVAVRLQVAVHPVHQRAEEPAPTELGAVRRVGAEEHVHPLRGGARFDAALDGPHVLEDGDEGVLAHRVVAVAHGRAASHGVGVGGKFLGRDSGRGREVASWA